MKSIKLLITLYLILNTLPILAQDAGTPLRIQGLDQFSLTGTRARGMGGSVLATGGDANALFSNPALLTKVKTLNVQVGSGAVNSYAGQWQEWHPNEYYAEMSLVIDGSILNVIDTLPQKLARAYDRISPNWGEEKTRMAPVNIAVSLPFELFETKFNVAAGMSEAVSLNNYFQNNNVLDPNVGQYRPYPIVRPRVGDSLKVQWYQFIRERSGSVMQYTFGGAVDLLENVTVGLSGAVYSGTSDDLQKRTDRGLFILKTNGSSGFNVMRNDSIYHHVTIKGTSDYSGMNGTIAVSYHNPTFTASAVIVTPLEITREWKQTVQNDTASSSTMIARNGKDKISVPLQYSFGLSIRPSGKVLIGLDYSIRSYAETKYSAADTSYNPWLNSSVLRAGIEYTPAKWIALRAGYRENVMTFASTGAAILNDPVRGAVYTLGVGTKLFSVKIDAAYEYGETKFIDAWESNLNHNTLRTHTLLFELGYDL